MRLRLPWRRRKTDALAEEQDAEAHLAEWCEPQHRLRPAGLLVLDEAPWAEARLILEADAPEYPESSWGRAQLGRFLYWKNGIAAGISEWHLEIAS